MPLLAVCEAPLLGQNTRNSIVPITNSFGSSLFVSCVFLCAFVFVLFSLYFVVFVLRVACCVLRVVCCVLGAACCVLRVEW